MSIIEDGQRSIDPRLIRWGGYGLTIVGVAAVILAAWKPDMLTTALALLLALAPVAIAAAWPQVFEVNMRRGRGFNPVVGAGALALLLWGLNVHLIDERPPWIAALVVGGAVTGAGWAAAQQPGLLSAPLQTLASLAAMGAVYGFGGYAVADTRFDPSPGTVYQAAVVGKYTSHGRSSTYYHLQLPPWGPQPAPSSVTVSSGLYNALQPGDVICMTLHSGAMSGAWYTAGPCVAGPS